MDADCSSGRAAAEQLEKSYAPIRLVQVAEKSETADRTEYTIVCSEDMVDRCLIDNIEEQFDIVIESVAADPDDSSDNIEDIKGPNIPTCVVFYAVDDKNSN